MGLELYYKSEKFVIEIFKKRQDDVGITHFLRTVHWLKVLKPDADEAFLIAAISHDIERGFRSSSYGKITSSKKGYADESHLKHHQEEGARIICEFLKKQKADAKIISRVKMLVAKHEVGGNEDQNILKDADSISFFENNIEHFLEKKVKETGPEKVKEKFDWMFNRITSEQAKQIAGPFYKEAIRKLK